VEGQVLLLDALGAADMDYLSRLEELLDQAAAPDSLQAVLLEHARRLRAEARTREEAALDAARRLETALEQGQQGARSSVMDLVVAQAERVAQRQEEVRLVDLAASLVLRPPVEAVAVEVVMEAETAVAATMEKIAVAQAKAAKAQEQVAAARERIAALKAAAAERNEVPAALPLHSAPLPSHPLPQAEPSHWGTGGKVLRDRHLAAHPREVQAVQRSRERAAAPGRAAYGSHAQLQRGPRRRGGARGGGGGTARPTSTPGEE
jgi:hypothetical protein